MRNLKLHMKFISPVFLTSPCGPKPHGFFMHPLLLKSTAGRRKNRMKSALEGYSSRKKSGTEEGTGRKKLECLICHQLGHHWYTCKNGNPEDIAAVEAVRGSPKKRVKKAATCNTRLVL